MCVSYMFRTATAIRRYSLFTCFRFSITAVKLRRVEPLIETPSQNSGTSLAICKVF